MDPLAAALQLLQEAQQIIAMQAEEIQALRGQSKQAKPKEAMQKQGSLTKIAMITGFQEQEVPNFLKYANEDELRNFMTTIEERGRQTAIGKVAEINDGTSDDPGERLESALANLI